MIILDHDVVGHHSSDAKRVGQGLEFDPEGSQ